MRWRLSISVCVALALASAAGRAQTPEPDHVTWGRAEFEAGREALKQGDFTNALSHFRASLTLHRTAGTLLNLANCEERLDMVASAYAHYEEALAALPAEDDRVPVAKDRMAALQPRVPAVRIRFDGGARPGAAVHLDGVEMASSALGSDFVADPGPHVLTITEPGRQEKRYDVTLELGERYTVIVPPLAPTRPLVLRAPRPLASTRPFTPVLGVNLWTAGLVTLGVSGAAAIAGAVTAGLSLSRTQELDRACPGDGPRTCDRALESAHSTGLALAHATTALFVFSRLGFAVGGGLLIAGRSEGAGRAPAQLTIGPGAIGVRGRF